MSDTLTIPDEIAKRAARLINEAEDMRAQAVDDLKTIYGDLREELKALGWAGQNVSKEVAALKGAIAEIRLDEEKRAKREEKGDRVDDYVSILSRGRARAPARTRENIAKFDPDTGEVLDDEPVTIIDQTDSDGHHITVTVDPQIAAILARSEERRSDGGLNIVTKHTEIATATQGEIKSHSAGVETDGANAGGDDVDSSAARAGPEGPSSIEPTGPVAERATSLAREFGLNVESEMTDGHDQDEAEDSVVYEDVPPRPMKSLGYASCFPELSHAQYQRLSDSIASNGVNVPIVRMGDVIVDGWNRYNICRSLGIRYPVEEYSGNDVLLDMIAWQREARQFTPAQERQIADRLSKEIPHRAADIRAAFSLEKEMA